MAPETVNNANVELAWTLDGRKRGREWGVSSESRCGIECDRQLLPAYDSGLCKLADNGVPEGS